MKDHGIPVISWILLAIGLVLIGLFIADKVDTVIGICGMILCALSTATGSRRPSNKETS